MKSKFLLHGILSPTRASQWVAGPPFPSLNIQAVFSVGFFIFTLFCCDCNPPAFAWLDTTCHTNSSAHQLPFQRSLPWPLNLISNAHPHHLPSFSSSPSLFLHNTCHCHFPSCLGWGMFSLPKLEREFHEKRGLVCLMCPRIPKPAILFEWMNEWQIGPYP